LFTLQATYLPVAKPDVQRRIADLNAPAEPTLEESLRARASSSDSHRAASTKTVSDHQEQTPLQASRKVTPDDVIERIEIDVDPDLVLPREVSKNMAGNDAVPAEVKVSEQKPADQARDDPRLLRVELNGRHVYQTTAADRRGLLLGRAASRPSAAEAKSSLSVDRTFLQQDSDDAALPEEGSLLKKMKSTA
jgi:hypothetical protein